MIPAGPEGTSSIHWVWNEALNWGKDKLQPKQAGEPVIYPYSIVPGGIHSLAELRQAMKRDPVVAAAYAKFNLSKFRVIKLRHDEYMYVSYRIGSDVFWTKKRLRICKGETVVTDGEYFARTRCGNQLSQVPQVSTWSSEPPPAVLDTPVVGSPASTDAFAATGAELLPVTPGLVPVSPEVAALTPDATPATPANLGSAFVGGLTPFVAAPLIDSYGTSTPVVTCRSTASCATSPRPKSPPPLSPVPEESSWIMLAAGLAGLGFYKRVLSRRSLRASLWRCE
jgi:hypothetical protein